MITKTPRNAVPTTRASAGSGIATARRGALLVVLLLVVAAVAPAAHAAEAERILVMNAHLISRDAPSADVRVNLLIVGGRLAVVTRDALVVQPGDVAVDASEGFLFGELVLGRSPSFVILDRDPREDFNVMLDTGSHVRFAVEAGAIVLNELPEVVQPGR